MKRIVFLIVLVAASIATQAQFWQGNYNVATYKDYDTTTFILNIDKDVHIITVDFPLVNSDDIVMKVGIPEPDGQGVGNLSWTLGATTADSIILNKTIYTSKIRNSAGTRYETTRVRLWFADAIPEGQIAFTFVWGTATTGRVRVGWRKQ
jgi:hypothetical protein